jgi:hypothetical protein
MFGNRSLKRVFGPKREKLRGRLRKVKKGKNTAIWTLLPIMIKVLRSRRFPSVGHLAHMRETKNAFKNLIVEQEGKRPL